MYTKIKNRVLCERLDKDKYHLCILDNVIIYYYETVLLFLATPNV